MNFELTEKSQSYLEKLSRFFEANIYPHEEEANKFHHAHEILLKHPKKSISSWYHSSGLSILKIEGVKIETQFIMKILPRLQGVPDGIV